MPKVFTIKDTGDALNKLFADVAQLKQQVTSPKVMGNSGGGGNEFEEVVIGPEGGPHIVLDVTVSAPLPADGQTEAEPLLLEVGAYMDDVFVDVTWNSPEDNSAATYEIEMVKETAPDVFSLETILSTGSNSIRFRGLEPNSSYGFRVRSVNRLGVRSDPIPDGWQTIQTGIDTTAPDPPTGLSVSRGSTTLVVLYTQPADADVVNGNGQYEVQIDTANTFDTANLRSVYVTATIVAFPDINAEGIWFARVRAIDKSGNVSIWSPVVSTTAGGITGAMLKDEIISNAKLVDGAVASAKLAANAVTSTKISDDAVTSPKIIANAITSAKIVSGAVIADKIAANAVTATKILADSISSTHIQSGTIASDHIVTGGLSAADIKYGFMSGDRISTNSLDAAKIKTSTLTSGIVTINGGGIKVGNPPTSGLLLNSQGLRGYLSGVESFVLDNSGNLTVKGLIDGSYAVASVFNFGGGDLSDTGGLRFLVNSVGYQTNRMVQWIDSGSPYTARWQFFAANQSELYLRRVNKSSGQYSSFYVRSDRTYFENISGSSMGYFFWNGSGTYDHGLSVDGYFYASTKGFVIDHPETPDEKLLIHTCIEGPEVGVYYRGMAKLDDKGEATVALPSYFEALTFEENRTVSVTAIGKDVALGSSYPQNGEFQVFGPRGVEFFWHVYAERSDAPRLVTEMDKEELALADELAKIGALPGQAEEHDDAATPEGARRVPRSRSEWLRDRSDRSDRIFARSGIESDS